MPRRAVATAALLLVAVCGCGSSPPPPAARPERAPGATCRTSADCPPDRVCGYALRDGCGAVGRCVERGPLCNALSPGCGCAGDTFNLICAGYPSGYASQPLAHAGPCEAPPSPSSAPPGELPWTAPPSTCANGGSPCGTVCCAPGEECCPGGMRDSQYCHAPSSPGADCPAVQ